MVSKKVVTILVFIFALTTSRAQYAFIPDTNFRNFLMTNGFAGCMQGDSLDTTCTAVVTATKINCGIKNIHNLEGIQYFDNLDTLYCNNDSISYLPPLPDSLKRLNCSSNRLTNLPTLPNGILSVDCHRNQLTGLPTLPSGIEFLDCGQNQLSGLPSLPPALIWLYCYYNQITTLPALPGLLEMLDCGTNQLSSLPTLPLTLTNLRAGQNALTSIPSLPSSLSIFGCDYNQLTSIPPLPTGLYGFYCNGNAVFNLPTLPSDLAYLYCHNCQLTSLPILPPSLVELGCDSNQISVLPALPSSLRVLDCTHNSLSSLPILPLPMVYLTCSNNFISNLPMLPDLLTDLRCNNNLITSMPLLPSYMNYLNCENNQIGMFANFPDSVSNFLLGDNPITCIPPINYINYFRWANTNIECLPNIGRINIAYPLIDTLPLCQFTDSCPSFWNINGQVYYDTDSSCTFDVSEFGLKNIPVILDSGGVELQQMLTDNFGRFSFQTGFGDYLIRVDTTGATYRVVCPVTFSDSSHITLIDSMDTGIDFGLLCRLGFDLITRSVAPQHSFRPGFQNTVYLNAGDGMSFSGISCANGLSGFVHAILDNLVSYVSPALGALVPSSVNGDTITWNISDFSLLDPVHDFNIIVAVSSSATINDSICIELIVNPIAGDNIPLNNTLTVCYPVVGSYDPNEKYMSPSGIVDTNQQWFTFTIFFQNVGTAPAEDIYILDTLDQNLDATTFTYLSSSHDVITQLLPGNILRFNYPDIYLADSTTDEPASHGYVKFRVKRKENLPVNTTITNTAHIYFDFNAAVVTNTTSATLSTSVGMNENYLQGIIIYPNPVQSQLTVESKHSKISSIEILSIVGEQVYSLNEGNDKRQTIGVANFAEGIYIVKINLENKIVVERFVKQ